MTLGRVGGAGGGAGGEEVLAQRPALVVFGGPEGSELDLEVGGGLHHEGALDAQVEVEGGGGSLDHLEEAGFQGLVGQVVLDLGLEVHPDDLLGGLLLLLGRTSLLDKLLDSLLQTVDAENRSLLVASDSHVG